MWEKVKIKNITINLDNRRKPLNEQERNKISKKKLYPYIGANNIMDYVDEYLFDEEIICIAEDGGSWGEHQKCVVHFSEKCWVNNHAHVLSSNGKSDLKYLMYYLNAKDLTKFITGSTRGKLTKSALDSIQIPLPPLAIQKRIAEILDTADALRRKDEALLKKYDELAQAIFIDMFGDPVKNEKGWEVKKLGEVCEKITDGEHLNPTTVTKGKPLIMAKDIRYDGIDFSDYKCVSENDFQKFTKKCNPAFGDLILVSRGATIGRCCVVETNINFCLMGSTILIKPNKNLSIYFLNQLFKIENFKYRLNNVSSASAQQAIYISNVKELNIPIPPIKNQIKYEQFINKLKLQLQKAILINKNSENLFHSLLQKAFNGELIV